MIVLTVLFLVEKSKRQRLFLSQRSAVFPRTKNLHTTETSKGSDFGWLIKQMSINQKKWQTFRRRLVSGCVFVSPCPPECYSLVIYKAKQKLSLISGYDLVGDAKLVNLALWRKREYI